MEQFRCSSRRGICPVDLWYPLISYHHFDILSKTSTDISPAMQDSKTQYIHIIIPFIYIYTYILGSTLFILVDSCLFTAPWCWCCTWMALVVDAAIACDRNAVKFRENWPFEEPEPSEKVPLSELWMNICHVYIWCMLMYIWCMSMYVDVCWCILMCVDVWWCILMCVDVWWCVLMYVYVCWCTLMYVDVCWCALMCDDVCWCVLMCVDVCWCSLMCVDVRWCMLMHVDVCWCIMNIWTWIANWLQMDCKWQHLMFPYTWVIFRATLSQAALRVAKGRRDERYERWKHRHTSWPRHFFNSFPRGSRCLSSRGWCVGSSSPRRIAKISPSLAAVGFTRFIYVSCCMLLLVYKFRRIIFDYLDLSILEYLSLSV